jgi:hypothetical protein
MRNIQLSRIGGSVLLLLLLLPGYLFAQLDYTTIKYKGIRPDDRKGLIPLRNPGRGLRIDVALDLMTQMNPYNKIKGVGAVIDSELDKYASDSVSVVQSCFYLSGFEGIQLSDSALVTLQAYFNVIRAKGMKTLVRFAYETESETTKGATYADISTHLEQMQYILERNKDIIMAVQAGLIGVDGDWLKMRGTLGADKELRLAILKKLLASIPVNCILQVRLPEIKNLISIEDLDYKRIGFYDDMIVSKPNKLDGGIREGAPAYEQMTRESATLLMDGALPKGSWSISKEGAMVDGLKTALRFRLHHFTTLSLSWNNKENGPDKNYSMDRWRDLPLTPEKLALLKLPVAGDYFMASSGNVVQRSAYEYIRDHIGYRIELQSLMLPAKRPDNSPIKLKLELINKGFANIKQICTLAFVLIDPSGQVYELAADATPENWQPFAFGDPEFKPLTHEVVYQGQLPKKLIPGKYILGLWIADGNQRLHYDYRYAIRCANRGVKWWVSNDGRYGINVLTTLTMSK